MPWPQVGNPISAQCSGPIGEVGSWFHAPAGAGAAPDAGVDPGLRSATAAIAAAAAPVLSRSRRVSRTLGCSVAMLYLCSDVPSSSPSADRLMERVDGHSVAATAAGPRRRFCAAAGVSGISRKG